MLDPVTTAMGAWLGEWATVAIAGKIVQDVGAKLNADEVSRALKEATRTASEEHRLFYRCLPKGIEKFLEQFFQGKGLAELQKPLNDLGEPDVAFLVKAFEQSADQHPAKIQIEYLRPWMEVFVQVYFARTNCFIGFQVAKDDYLKQLVNQFDDVKFAGIATPGDERSKKAISLEHIFVMLKVREEGRREEMDFGLSEEMGRQGLLLAEQRSRLRLERTAPAISAERLVEQKRSVILGAPGSGKTTLMSYFAVRLAVGQEDRLPILVRIRDWALQPQMSLLEYLRYFAEKRLQTKSLPVGFFEHWLDAGRALILLDGLDEVADEAKRYVLVEQIECFLGQDRNVRNPAIITSRPAGYRRDFLKTAEFPHYELLPFDDGQMQEFVDRWYESREPDPVEREQRKQSLRKAFEGSNRIKRLAGNPLLLTIMVLIHRYQAVLPKERHKLYDKAVETLLLSWDGNKELTHQAKLEYLKLDDLRRLMEQVAYWIHTHGSTGDVEGGTLIDQDELIRQLSQDIKALKSIELYQAKEEAKRFLVFIRERTGLMNEQGEDCYAFVHKTFQEYLCAQDIIYRADNDDDFGIVLQYVRLHLHDQHWREVLLLLIGQQKPKKAATAIREILNQNSEYEPWLHRDFLFAAVCLTENIKGLNGADPELLHPVLEGLVGLELSNYRRVGDRVKGVSQRVLLDFSETEFETLVLQSLDEHKGCIDEERFQEFRAALGEQDLVISELLQLLTDTALYTHHSVANALVRLGDRSEYIITILLKLLTNPDSEVSSATAFILGRLGKRSECITMALLESLTHPDSEVRSSASLALGDLGERSERIITALIELLNDTDPFVRCNTADALGKLGEHRDHVITTLLELLIDTKSGISHCAVDVLVKLGDCSEYVIKALLKLLTHSDLAVGLNAAEALVKLGDRSERVIAALLELLPHKASVVRFKAAEVLVKLGDRSERLIVALLELLTDTESLVRSNAALALGNLGDRSEHIITALIELLTDTERYVRSKAAFALGNLSDCSERVIVALLELLTDLEPDVRSEAADALGKLGKRSPEILPRIIQWIEAHENSDIVGAGIDVLWAIVVE
jgi:HEAT repeat protein